MFVSKMPAASRTSLAAAAAAAAVLLAAALLPQSALAAVPISSANRLFGHAVKNAPLAAYPAEQTSFEHNCSSAAAVCVVTQVHVPSIYPQNGDPWDWENGVIRFYVDNEVNASIQLRIRELANVGRLGAVGDGAADGSPFGTDLFGKTAKSGGVYSTVRVPFAVSLRVTIQNAPSAVQPGIYWLIVRGIEALPVLLGDFQLPDQARLHMARNDDVLLAPQQLLTIAQASAGVAGALVSVFFDNNSTDFNFLEACVRYTPDGAAAPLFLSSGTEDFFLSASYFDEGMFQNGQSGTTYLAGGNSVAMYKTHASRDPILWNDGMIL